MTSEELIIRFDLLPHPEGGYYRETYRSAQQVTFDNKIRNAGTAIYFLLRDNEISHFHRVASDELWLFHQGNTIDIYVISKSGELNIRSLGNHFENREEPQVLVEAGDWFAAKLKHNKGFALVSCIVTPGFEFIDFEQAEKDILAEQYPDHRKIISELAL